MKTKKPAPAPVNATEEVNAFMAKLTHPFKAEVEAVRAIVKQANPQIGERVKGNAPSFFYKNDLGSFNLQAKDCAQLVLIFHDGKMIENRLDLLEGDFKDRRTAKFYSPADVRSKKTALMKVVRAWVKLADDSPPAVD